MKTIIMKCLALVLCFGVMANAADAQAKKRTAKKRTTAKKTTAARSNANINPAATDTAIVMAPADSSMKDSLPITTVKPSLRPETALDNHNALIQDRTPLPYQHLRQEDAAYDERIWREIDTREKINLPFRYSADEDNGNQRFISILFKAIQDGPDNGGVTAFSADDDRFTTPLTKAQLSTKISGGSVSVPIYDTLGNVVGNKEVMQEVNLDSFYKFMIKEEVIFDKANSRLFWRILGIAPVKRVITASGVDLGDSPLFWVYYPDMRPIFAKYYVYNAKNYGARMTWEDLFESRMFHGRIIKSTLNNPFNEYLSNQTGLKQSPMLQLLEGDKIQNDIFDYEQNLWSY